jgi:hypothetical protein
LVFPQLQAVPNSAGGKEAPHDCSCSGRELRLLINFRGKLVLSIQKYRNGSPCEQKQVNHGPHDKQEANPDRYGIPCASFSTGQVSSTFEKHQETPPGKIYKYIIIEIINGQEQSNMMTVPSWNSYIRMKNVLPCSVQLHASVLSLHRCSYRFVRVIAEITLSTYDFCASGTSMSLPAWACFSCAPVSPKRRSRF